MSVLVEYDFGASEVLNPTTTDSNVGATAIGNGSLTQFATFSLGYSTDPELSLHSASGATTQALAVTTNSYFYFTITPNANKYISLTTLTFTGARGGAGTPRGYGVRSSIDTYGADIQTADIGTVRTTWENESVDLSASQYQNITSAITFRIYVYAPATGSAVEFDTIKLNGTSGASGGASGIQTLNNGFWGEQ